MKSIWISILLIFFAFTTGSPAAPTEPNQGMGFNPKKEILEVPYTPALDLMDEVTLEAWVKVNRMPVGGGRIFDHSKPETELGYVLDTFPGNSLRFLGGAGWLKCDAHLTKDEWTHAVGVYSASKKIMKIYVNGNEVAFRDAAFPKMGTVKSPLRIGGDSKGEHRFDGRILRAAIYGRALTPEEIARRFAKPTPLPGVLAEWEMTHVTPVKPIIGTLVLEPILRPSH